MSMRVLILGIMVAASSGVAYWLTTQEDKTQQQTQSVLLSGLQKQASAVNAIAIENASGVVFSAKQENGQWQATHLDTQLTFPVDLAPMSALVSAMSQAQILEQKTAKADYYDRLGVEGLAAPDAQSSMVTLSTGKQQWKLLVGLAASSGLGNYVRDPQKPTSYLIDQNITLPSGKTDWLSHDILPFNADAVASIRIDVNNKKAVWLVNSGERGWELDGQSLNETLLYPTVVKQTVDSMMDLQFEDVKPYSQNQWDKHVLIGDVVFTLQDGSEVFAYLSEADEQGQHLIWFSTPDSPSWISDWVFTLSEYQSKAYLKSRSDLLQQDAK